MITNDDVLKAIVSCKNSDNQVDYSDVCEKLNIDDISLIPFLKYLNKSGYITQTTSDIYITSLGMSAYNDLTLKSKAKKSIYNFSKFTLQRFVDIGIGIIIGVSVSAIAHHFGW